MANGVAEAQSVGEAGINQRRQHIIEAAKRCVARSGFHAASMHEICAEAGMSPGAVYRYFRSKDEIIAAIAEDEQKRTALLFLSASSEGGFHERMLAIGRLFLRDMAEPGRVPLMVEIMAESLRNPEVAVLFRRAQDACRQLFADLLRRAVEAEEVELPVDFDIALTCLMAVGEGLAFRMATDPTLTPERAEPMMKAMAAGLFPTRGSKSWVAKAGAENGCCAVAG